MNCFTKIFLQYLRRVSHNRYNDLPRVVWIFTPVSVELEALLAWVRNPTSSIFSVIHRIYSNVRLQVRGKSCLNNFCSIAIKKAATVNIRNDLRSQDFLFQGVWSILNNRKNVSIILLRKKPICHPGTTPMGCWDLSGRHARHAYSSSMTAPKRRSKILHAEVAMGIRERPRSPKYGFK